VLNPATLQYRQFRCPQEYQDRLTDIGGVNRYDEPNFLLVWGQGGDEQARFRAGGAWEADGVPSFIGYRDLLIGSGQSCWCLLQWHDPLEYGTPEIYYVQNYNEYTGLQDLGEFPYKGRYQMLYSLCYRERRGNEMHIERMPLNNYLLETIIPIITHAKQIGWEKTKAALTEMRAREDAHEVDRIEDIMRDKAVPFRHSTASFSKAGCHSDIIDKKVMSLQLNLQKILKNVSQFSKGFQVK
jgi:hypothetical protein